MSIEKILVSEISENSNVKFEFIKTYIDDYIKKERLKHYYSHLYDSLPKEIIKSNLLCVYSPKEKSIHMDNKKIIEAITNLTYLKNKPVFNKEDLIFLYAIYLNYITHELRHVAQNKIIHSFNSTPEVELLKDSFTVHDKYYEFYLKNPSIFISEHNADIQSGFEIFDLLDGANLLYDQRVLNEYNCFLGKQITKNYQAYGDVLVAPALTFYNNFKEKDKFFVLDKRIKQDNLTRILYGMPFDSSLYYQLKQVADREKDVHSIKKLILESRNYGKTI